MSRVILPVAFIVCCCCAFWGGVNAGLLADLQETEAMQERVDPMPQFGAQPGEFSDHRSTNDGRDLGGITQRPGLSIHWAGSDRTDENVRPREVIQATIERMEAEQKTDLGSDANARALVDLMQARDKLRGNVTEINGVPIIQ